MITRRIHVPSTLNCRYNLFYMLLSVSENFILIGFLEREICRKIGSNVLRIDFETEEAQEHQA